ACRLLDLTEANGRTVDRLIGLKFPAYLIRHPNKVLWILHQHRQAYEMWDHPLGDMIRCAGGEEARDAIRRADAQLIPEAKAVFANSQNVANRLKQFCGLDSTPLYHPPHQADTFYCEADDGYFLYPSRINAAKRQHLAVEGLAGTGSNSRLVICGESEDDTYLQSIHVLVEKLGLRERVQFLGRVGDEEKLRLFARCRAVVYPPVDEDYGYVTLEAMLASKPVVTCADSGGPLEFLEHGVTGLVAEPECAAMQAAMAQLAVDPTKAAAMGRAGREAYLARGITWENVVTRLLA
ncbi:MAG: glycosyltransferase family 4 protein, partial [Chthoniobacterales bacterium]